MAARKKEEQTPQGEVQGEGDYRSAREFNEKERSFVRSHDTERLAEEATPENAEQAAEMERAEREGKERARPDPETGKAGQRDKGSTKDGTPP
jgi:hypothetical protein